MIERFSLRYPKVTLHISETSVRQHGYVELHDRRADVVLTLSLKPLEGELSDDLQAEVLFYERICLAAAMQSPWARRRKIDLADLADAAFIAPGIETPGGAAVIEAFRTAGLPMPQVTVTAFSVHVRNILSMRGRFIAALPASILRSNPDLYSLKALPVDVPMPRWPALMVTLKHRTLSPAVERFMDYARDVAKAMDAPLPPQKSGAMRTHASVTEKANAVRRRLRTDS